MSNIAEYTITHSVDIPTREYLDNHAYVSTSSNMMFDVSSLEIDALKVRIQQLEQQVEIFKTAAITLKELNEDRIKSQQPQLGALLVQEDPISNYDRAMKVVK